MWELLTHSHPYDEYRFGFWFELEQAIIAGKRPSIPSEFQFHKRAYGHKKHTVAEHYVDWIQQCWSNNPDDRPSFAILTYGLESLLNKLHVANSPSSFASQGLDPDELTTDFASVSVTRLRSQLVLMAAFEDGVAVACADRSVSLFNKRVCTRCSPCLWHD
jgi:hypothetical protein